MVPDTVWNHLFLLYSKRAWYKKRIGENDSIEERVAKLEERVQSLEGTVGQLQAQVQRQKDFEQDTCLSFSRVWSYMGELDQRTQAGNNPAVMRTLSFDFVEQGAAQPFPPARSRTR